MPTKRFLLGIVSGMVLGLLMAGSWPLSGLKLSGQLPGSYAAHRWQNGDFRRTASRQRSGEANMRNMRLLGDSAKLVC